MTDADAAARERRVLVLAPSGRDAALARDVFGRAGVGCHVCADLAEGCAELDAGAGALLLAEEAAGPDGVGRLAGWLAGQPPWSDLPLLLLARPGADSPAVARAIERLGNVTVLERPARVAALVTAARTALRSRDRQYQAREHLAERERAAELVRASEARFRSFADTAPAMLWVTEADGACSFISHGWYEFTGQAEGAGLGFGWLNAVHPDDRPAARDAFLAANARRAPFVSEHRLQRAGGGYGWVIDAGRPRAGPGGEVLGYIGSVIDITDRKRAEDESARLAEELRLIADAVPSLISYVDAGGRYRFNNKAYEDWFGRRREDIHGRHMREVLGEEAYERLRPHVEAALAGRRLHAEMEVPYKDGGTRYVMVEYVPDEKPGGAVAGYYALVTDITDRKRAEERVRAGEARQAFLVRLGDTLRPLSDPADIQAAAGRALGEHFGANRVAYFEIRGADYVIERDYAAGVESITGRYPVAAFGAELLASLLAGRTIVETDATAQPDRTPAERAAFAAIRVRGHVGVPLVKGGEFVAGMAVHFREPRAWAADEVALVVETAERTWAAVERARAERALRASEGRFRFLDAVGQATRAADDPVAVMAAAARTLGEHLGVTRCAYADVDADGDRFTIRDDWRAPAVATTAGVYSLDLFGPRAAAELRAGGTLVVRDVDAELAPAAGADTFNAIGIKAIVCCPLVKEGRLRAMMAVHHAAPRDWAADEVALVREAAERAWAHIERVRAAAELRASEERYRTLFESMDEGFCVIEVLDDAAGRPADYRFVEVNPAFEKHTGLQDVVGRTIREFAPAHEQFWFDAYGRVAATGEPARFEHRADALGGRWFDVYAFRVGDPADRRVAVLFNDISARRRAEDERREHERRFRTLVEQVQDYAIFTTDTAGRPTSWNEGVHRVLGFDEAEFLGADIIPIMFTPEDLADGVPGAELAEAAAAGRAGNDRWMRRKDGTRFFALGATTGLHDAAGTLLGYLKVMRDQTERKQMEDDLRRAVADLSEADRRKNEFLAMLAHELRNPLAPIRNSLHILRLTAGAANGASGGVHDMMERQVAHMVRLVDDLLEVSRITRGKIDLRREPVGVAAVLGTAVETSRPLIDAAGHRLTVDVPAEPLVVDGDAVRLAQVFANLLNNAAKYTPEGGDIRLAARRDGAEAVVSVRDTGAGIPREMLTRVFELFTQIDRSDARAQGGLGIGLTLVKSLVELHGGRVSVASDGPGTGSEFTVRLPLAGAAARVS